MEIHKIIRQKMIHAQRYFMLYFASRFIPIILVTEYPRSGGTWFCQLLSNCLNMYFPTNEFPKFIPGIYHGHYKPSPLMNKICKKILIVRDGRDVVISNYFKRLHHKINGNYTRDVMYYRKYFNFSDYNDVKSNLPKFIEGLFTMKPKKSYRFTWEGNWYSFNKAWLDYGVDKIVKYEDMLKDTYSVLDDVTKNIFNKKLNRDTIKKIVEMFSFSNIVKGRKNKIDNGSTIRKGIAGDYKNYFTKEAAEIFDYYAGELLIVLGYEKDNKWINNF